MSLRNQIQEKLNQALKAKDKNTYPTLRLVVSAIKDAEIAGRSKGQKEMTDADITAILKKMIKQRNESCEVYKKAGRKELFDNEMREISIISSLLLKNCVFVFFNLTSFIILNIALLTLLLMMKIVL